MHPDAYDILSHCFLKRLPVNIATNAINIKTDYFRQYIGTDLLTIQISLDGMEDAHDRRRGSGTWKKTVTNAIILDEMGIPVTANMTLDPDNYTDALEVMELPFFTSISFTPVAYAGAVTLNSNKKGLAEYEEFVIHIMKSFECEKKTLQIRSFLTSYQSNMMAVFIFLLLPETTIYFASEISMKTIFRIFVVLFTVATNTKKCQHLIRPISTNVTIAMQQMCATVVVACVH